MTPDEMTAAIRRLLDKDEIVDLVHRYSHYVDHKLHDALAELFTENCVIDYGPGNGPAIHGRVTFRALLGSGDYYTDTSHHNANVLVDFDGADRASVRTSLYAWHKTHAGTTPQCWGCYHDVVERTPQGWRIARRQLRIAGQEDFDIEWLPLIDPANKDAW